MFPRPIAHHEPFWHSVRRNRREVATGAAAFAACAITGAIVCVPLFKLLAAFLLILSMLTGG